MSTRTHYEVLGLDPDATADDIRRAWKTLIQVWHPDRFAGHLRQEAEEMSKAVNEAYRVLSDPATRREYDAGSPTTAEDRQGSHRANSSRSASAMADTNSQLTAVQLQWVTFGIASAVALLVWKLFHGGGSGYMLLLGGVAVGAFVINQTHPPADDAPDEVDLGDPRVWLYVSSAVATLAVLARAVA
jgi:hypothetical protein